MRRVFGHGGLRLYLLSLLAEGPKHGYELIRMVEDRFLGMYTPSAGTIYPRLAALEEDGLITHDLIDGRKVYRLTDAGREELDARQDDLDDAHTEAIRSARQLANEIRDEVRASVRDFRDAMKDVRREERRTARDWTDEFRGGPFGPGPRHRHRERDRDRDHDADDVRLAMRSLRADLEAFGADVVAAARRHHLDASLVRSVRETLLDAREAVIDALRGSSAAPGAQEPQPEDHA
jgi:DNA-binding PadR family transcriptional regulator